MINNQIDKRFIGDKIDADSNPSLISGHYVGLRDKVWLSRTEVKLNKLFWKLADAGADKDKLNDLIDLVRMQVFEEGEYNEE